jgi:Zn-dependent protease
MTPSKQGSIRLFRLFGIDVYLHWSWFLLAMWALDQRKGVYSQPVWNVIEYVGLFAIVLMHEFGHSLACKQVGGKADQIVLWPFGGVAYVAPPQRPGAELWSIAAGPLVNVVLVPVFFLITQYGESAGWWATRPDVWRLAVTLSYINIALLIFNLLPIYPLDGGQILRSLLWFPLGRSKSLKVATIIGFLGVAILAIYALMDMQIWLLILTAFIFMNCKQGWQHARALGHAEALPRRRGFHCPQCKASPPEGTYWTCGKCNTAFDMFAEMGTCPNCSAGYSAARCIDCGAWTPLREWTARPDSATRAEKPYV